MLFGLKKNCVYLFNLFLSCFEGAASDKPFLSGDYIIVVVPSEEDWLSVQFLVRQFFTEDQVTDFRRRGK